jgi:tripartite-type tricarboxylate transporter receptor subunit TctC
MRWGVMSMRLAAIAKLLFSLIMAAMPRCRFALAAAVVISGLGLGLVAAQADAVADFYRGRTVNLVVGYEPGGGYDLAARLVARHIGRHIPGNPSVVVQNMPGAGSLRATNFLYAVAPKDGATIGAFARDMPLLAVLGTMPGVRFDPRRFVWLGSSSGYRNDAYLLMVRKDAPVKSIEDARAPGGEPLVLGSTAEGTSGNDVPVLLRDLLGLNMKIVAGYPGNGAVFLAVDRGEVNARTIDVTTMRALRPDWLDPNGHMHALLQFARLTRHPDFPKVPTARELAGSPEALAMIDFAELPYQMARPFVAPPGIPADRAAALQAAFLAVHRDPEFLADAARLKIEADVVSAAEVRELIERTANAPATLLERFRRLFAAAEPSAGR